MAGVEKTIPAVPRSRIGALIVITILLVGCQEETAVEEQPPRPIKTYQVTEVAGGMVRKFSGISEAAESVSLSFPVAGTVQEIRVGVGDVVAEGDLVARLDPEPFDLDVQAARAEVEKADSDLAAKENDLGRNRTLFEKGIVSEAAVEKYQTARDAATSSLDYARSRLAQVERNQANAELRAPYAGTIASRLVDRFEDIAAGQPVVEINSTDGLLVAFAVPESGINRLRVGQKLTASFSSASDIPIEARITEIDTAASAGNAYTVKASLDKPPAELRPGMTAEVAIVDAAEGPDAGYFIPLSALVPGGDDEAVRVFKYDADAGVVRLTPIRVRGVRDNLVIVQEGIAPGDMIASAGVSFLMDGQAVRLLER